MFWDNFNLVEAAHQVEARVVVSSADFVKDVRDQWEEVRRLLSVFVQLAIINYESPGLLIGFRYENDRATEGRSGRPDDVLSKHIFNLSDDFVLERGSYSVGSSLDILGVVDQINPVLDRAVVFPNISVRSDERFRVPGDDFLQSGLGLCGETRLL